MFPMPRKPSQKHPVRDLRSILEISQGRFAEKIGIVPGTLKRIENNSLPLSRKLARRIMLEAGVDDGELLKGRLRSFPGVKYQKKDYELWKGTFGPDSPKEAEDEAMKLAAWIDILFQAAFEQSRLWQVNEAVVDTLDDCVKTFALQHKVDGILRRFGSLPDDKRRGFHWYGWHPSGGSDEFPRLWWQRKYRAIRAHSARWRRRHLARETKREVGRRQKSH
jgi:transcriptional regulator with XRE-family HTH domain